MYEPNQKAIAQSVAASKILSSETRIKILALLLQKRNEDICVKEIADAIGLSHSATSHQLAKLQDMGVVTPSRSGQTMCYNMTQSEFTKTLTRIMQYALNLK